MPFVWNGMMVATRPIAGGCVPNPESGMVVSGAAETRFMGLAERELDRLFRLAGLILGNASEAEDAVGDALLRGWRSAGSLRSEADFPAWLDRILVNICRDRLRRRSRIRFIPMTADHDRPGAGDPFRQLAENDELIALMKGLDPDERIVLVLHFGEDLTLEATAARLAWPVGTVKSRLSRGLDKMRRALAESESNR